MRSSSNVLLVAGCSNTQLVPFLAQRSQGASVPALTQRFLPESESKLAGQGAAMQRLSDSCSPLRQLTQALAPCMEEEGQRSAQELDDLG
jgi:hypothetical protein